VNLAHPVLVAFARDTWGLSRRELQEGTVLVLGTHAPKLGLDQYAITPQRLAKALGEPIEEIRRAIKDELASAVIPVEHVSVEEFALLAEAEVEEVLVACDGELGAAVVRCGRLNLVHSASLAFMAAHPFTFGDDGDPLIPDINGDGFLAPACVGDQVNLDHPRTRVLCARLGHEDDA
jgi:hypothetical protein